MLVLAKRTGAQAPRASARGIARSWRPEGGVVRDGVSKARRAEPLQSRMTGMPNMACQIGARKAPFCAPRGQVDAWMERGGRPPGILISPRAGARSLATQQSESGLFRAGQPRPLLRRPRAHSALQQPRPRLPAFRPALICSRKRDLVGRQRPAAARSGPGRKIGVPCFHPWPKGGDIRPGWASGRRSSPAEAGDIREPRQARRRPSTAFNVRRPRIPAAAAVELRPESKRAGSHGAGSREPRSA